MPATAEIVLEGEIPPGQLLSEGPFGEWTGYYASGEKEEPIIQVRSIIRSPYPGLRAIESLAVSVPLFLLLFAATYVVLSTLSARNFGVHLSRTDGLYFAVTVFATALVAVSH